MATGNKTLNLTLILLSSAAVCLGLNCFECNSRDDQSCEDPFDGNRNSRFLKECPYRIHESVCMKEVFHFEDGHTEVARGCGWHSHHKHHCYKLEHTNENGEVTMITDVCECMADMCNGAPKKINLMFLFLSAILLLLSGLS